MRHANISVFVPHMGCPHRCSFCDQGYITGEHEQPGAEDIDRAVSAAKHARHYDPKKTEIAFFGGSFTAIDRSYMLTLLSAAYRYVSGGEVSGIRISTRPDCIDSEILSVLGSYGVTAVELGAQSMSDEVLKLNHRGHTAQEVASASGLVKEAGFELGLQMMTGLYGDSSEGAVRTAERLIALAPDTVRIYPTVVLKNTGLAALYEAGKYEPQTLTEAVELCVRLSELFRTAGIRVIRLGLHSIDQSAYIAGPWHPAFRELCESEIYLRIIRQSLQKPGNYSISVKDTELSKAIGQSGANVKKLEASGYRVKIRPDPFLEQYQIKTEEVK